MQVHSIKPQVDATLSFKSAKKTSLRKNMEVENKEVLKETSKAFSNYFIATQNLNSTKTLALQGSQCSTKNFKVKKLTNIPCACCGKRMLTNTELERFVKQVGTPKFVKKSDAEAVLPKNTSEKAKKNKAADYAYLTGEKLVDVLKEYKKCYRPIEKVAMHAIVDLAHVRPKANIQEIVQEIAKTKIPKLEDEQKIILNKLKKASITYYGEKNKVAQLVDDTVKNMSNPDTNANKRRAFISQLEKITKQEYLYPAQHRRDLYDIAASLPSSRSSINAFFVKYANKTPKQIATRLLQPSMTTAEHVKPRSLGGKDDTSNYIAECMQCNSDRGHKPFSEWFKEYPNMRHNTQKYVNEVHHRILKGELVGYDDYPSDIKKTLFEETEGVIKLRVLKPDSVNYLKRLKANNAENKVVTQNKAAEEVPSNVSSIVPTEKTQEKQSA